MVECNSIETHHIYSNLNNQKQFRLNKINKIKDCFVAETKETESLSKKLIKYIVSFDYFVKHWITLSATTGIVSIASFATVIGVPVGMSCIFSFYRNCKKIVKNNTK